MDDLERVRVLKNMQTITLLQEQALLTLANSADEAGKPELRNELTDAIALCGKLVQAFQYALDQLHLGKGVSQ